MQTSETGELSFERLQRYEWFQLGFDLYSFDDPESYRRVLGELASRGGIRILAFLGVWCGDTHDQLPGFARILEAVKFPRGHVKWLALDRTKSVGAPELVARHRITKLPTFVVLEGDLELGRITETPKVSLLVDLAGILMSR
jgi:hypothetical protein